MDFGAIVVQKRVSRSKSVYFKNCICGSQGRWALCFCMEATESQVISILLWFEAHITIGFENKPWRHGHFGQIVKGKVVLSNDHVLVRIELRGAIVELAAKWKVTLSA